MTDATRAEYVPHPALTVECPAGGPHSYKFESAADQQDDSGRRFYDGWFCAECGASPPKDWPDPE